MNQSHYDAVVIGTGAAGACSAYSMATRGMRVLCLEKGPWLELSDFFEGGLFGKKFSSFGRGDELLYKEKEILMPPMSREIRYLNYENAGLQRTQFGWQSQMVGGGTVHYGGASFRAKPIDFLMKTTFSERDINGSLPADAAADLKDWPITYEDLVPWYELAERLIGIAGAPASGLPPLRFSKAAKLVDAALRNNPSLGAAVIPTPMAINTKNHDGRSPCHHSGLCQDFACRFEAKSDMRVTLLRKALLTGNLQIQPNVFVRKINLKAGRAVSLECIVGNEKPRVREVPCPILVVACEAIESVRLLLASNLGNSAVLGSYFMVHTTGGARSKAMSQRTETWDTAPHTAYIDSFYSASQEGENGFLKAGILLVSSASGPWFELNQKKIFGESAKLFLNEIFPYKMDLSYIGDGLATRQNRIRIRPKETDRFGMPATEIHYTPHPADMRAAEWIKTKAMEILEAAGGKTERSSDLPPALREMLRKQPTMKSLYHASGGARAGADSQDSVLDRDGKVHGFENVFVTDSSYFPSGLGVNPTLTIQANALRIGEHIAQRQVSEAKMPLGSPQPSKTV